MGPHEYGIELHRLSGGNGTVEVGRDTEEAHGVGSTVPSTASSDVEIASATMAGRLRFLSLPAFAPSNATASSRSTTSIPGTSAQIRYASRSVLSAPVVVTRTF